MENLKVLFLFNFHNYIFVDVTKYIHVRNYNFNLKIMYDLNQL